MKKIKEDGSECTNNNNNNNNNTQMNETVVENRFSKEESEATIEIKKPVVNVKVEFVDSFRTYLELEMVVTIQFLNELIKRNERQLGIDEMYSEKLYEKVIDSVFRPNGHHKYIQENILRYICNVENIQEQVILKPDGGFQIYSNIDINDDEYSFASVGLACCPHCGSQMNHEYSPLKDIGKLDVVFTTQSILTLLHNIDSGFYKNLTEFYSKNNVTTHSFTDEQLWEIFPRDEEICHGLLYDSLELIESYQLIEMERYLNKEEREINVISINENDIQSQILKKDENKKLNIKNNSHEKN